MGPKCYAFFGSCNQLGATPEQLHYIQKIQTIQYQIEQRDPSVAGLTKPPLYHRQEWNAMVYGCGMASATILDNLDTQLIEPHRRCLQGQDESFNNLGRIMLRRLMGIQPGNSRSNPSGWYLLHDFLNEELLGKDMPW